MSGTKRSPPEAPSDRRSKPRDWRDAFLDEDDRPRRDRDRGSDDRRRDERYRGDHGSRDERRRDDRDRTRDDRGKSARDKDRDHGHGHGHGYERRRDDRDRDRERERGERSRRYGDASYRRRDESRDREEGEISPVRPSPTGHPTALPYDEPKPGQAEPSQKKPLPPSANGHGPPASGSFKPVAIPSGPRSRVPLTRPLQAFDQPPTSENAKVVQTPEPEQEKSSEQILEERRKKREEIMAKFRASASAKPPAAVTKPDTVSIGTGADSVESGGKVTGNRTGTNTGATPLFKQLGTMSALATTAPTPAMASTPQGHEFELTRQAESAGDEVVPQPQGENISAADYDPTQEAIVDREKRIKDRQIADGVGEPGPTQEDEYEEVEMEVEEEDDDVDIFAMFGGEEKPKKKRKVMVRTLKAGGGDVQTVQPTKPVVHVIDNADDTDGYYRITPGELLDDGRYQVTINLGKGMFSGVVKAKVLKAVDQERRQDVVGKEVAIKVIRSQESMYVAGRKEAGILRKLNDADPEDKKHIVRLERTFEHRGHLCIVTESLSMNLRDVIKRFGKDVGLNMRAVRAYAHQMFLALSLMRKCSIVHADIKPDNILVTENKATLKVCDLGSASEVSDGEITPYLVSRFYRAPEIILGLPFDMAIDVWSVGCTLYELYTGKILFPGRSNNQMLLLMMEVKGKLNHRLIKKSSLGEMHFDESMNFISIEKDKITGADVAKTLVLSKATRDLRSRLLPPSSVQIKMKDDELRLLKSFVDLLEKCLELDPARRITPRDALLHPFLAG